MNSSIIGITPNSEDPFPPLPEPLPPFPIPNIPPESIPRLRPFPTPFPWPESRPPFVFRNLRCGCYLVNFKPKGNTTTIYDGTLRVECQNNGRTASGDLYQRTVIRLPRQPNFPNVLPVVLPGFGPSPLGGIPILARNRYRYYLRVTQILESFTVSNNFTLGFQMWRFNKIGRDWNNPGRWSNEGAVSADMAWQSAPAGYPSAEDYLEGDVTNSEGIVIGRLTMGWVSNYLRKASIEIDRVSHSEAPLNNGAGTDWQAVGDGIGWNIQVDESDSNIAEPGDQFWSDAELHNALLNQRDSSNLDAEWRYYVLAVRRLDSTSRGIMFDAYGGDSNDIPREGCAISSHWTVPNSAEWGTVQGMRFGTAAEPYFRTAVHEAGHAMGLYHNQADNGFMSTTNVIANNSLSPGVPPFPANIQWSFNSNDIKRLKHMPDIVVRPGGTPFGVAYASIPISPNDLVEDAEEIKLQVEPLLESVPLGAPVRIQLDLENIAQQAVYTPATLSMKHGFVKGTIVDPTGTIRTFSPLLRCIEEHPMAVLNPEQHITHAITLLRGPQGALFPTPGVYQIYVEVQWETGEIETVASAETQVMVSAAIDDKHAAAALKVLSTPNALLTLVMGGDHMTDAIEAIQTALDNPILRPHYTYIEAKRTAKRFAKRKADFANCAKLLDNASVMSSAEIKRIAEMIKGKEAKTVSGKKIANLLKTKLSEVKVTKDIKKLIDSF